MSQTLQKRIAQWEQTAKVKTESSLSLLYTPQDLPAAFSDQAALTCPIQNWTTMEFAQPREWLEKWDRGDLELHQDTVQIRGLYLRNAASPNKEDLKDLRQRGGLSSWHIITDMNPTTVMIGILQSAQESQTPFPHLRGSINWTDLDPSPETLCMHAFACTKLPLWENLGCLMSVPIDSNLDSEGFIRRWSVFLSTVQNLSAMGIAPVQIAKSIRFHIQMDQALFSTIVFAEACRRIWKKWCSAKLPEIYELLPTLPIHASIAQNQGESANVNPEEELILKTQLSACAAMAGCQSIGVEHALSHSRKSNAMRDMHHILKHEAGLTAHASFFSGNYLVESESERLANTVVSKLNLQEPMESSATDTLKLEEAVDAFTEIVSEEINWTTLPELDKALHTDTTNAMLKKGAA